MHAICGLLCMVRNRYSQLRRGTNRASIWEADHGVSRKERGISQVELGEQTGLGQPRLSRIEKGELAASVQVISKLAAALGRPFA